MQVIIGTNIILEATYSVDMVDRRRQWRAENQNINIKNKISKTVYTINGTRGIDYEVDFLEPSCECPDWQESQPDGGCKHILKLRLKHDLIDSLPNSNTGLNRSKSRIDDNYPDNWEYLSRQTKKRDNHVCQKCGKSKNDIDITLHAHHIIPKSKGGQDNMENLITLCDKCHQKEHGHKIKSDFDDQNEKHISIDGINRRQSVNKTGQPPSQKWWHFVALADLYIKSNEFRSSTSAHHKHVVDSNVNLDSKTQFTETESDDDDKNKKSIIEPRCDNKYNSDSDTNAKKSGATENTIEFTGTVVQAGNPTILDNGTETWQVNTDAELRLGEEISVFGVIENGTIQAKNVY